MKHQGTKTIETARLILRPFLHSDAPVMYQNWASDPEVTRYLTWPTHGSVEVTEWVIGSWLAQYEKPDYYHWAIELKEIGQPIGSIAVNALNEDIGMAHVGYCIGKAWWRRGITSEALGAVIDFLFGEVGAQRIEAMHDPRNPHSGTVMMKCGMRFEGTHRQADKNNQGICDASYYAILATDREERVHDQLQPNG